MKFNSRDLSTHNRCTKRRKFAEIITKQATNDIYTKSVVIKSAIKEYLLDEDWDKVIKSVQEGFKEISYKNDNTRAINIEESLKIIKRYVNWEKGKQRKPIIFDKQEINIFGIDVEISPDLYFITEDYIEVVKIKIGKPNITQTGKKLDASVYGCLELYAMLRVAEELAKTYPKKELKASYYFLRKKEDSYTKKIFDGCFNAGRDNNIVTLSYSDPDEKLFIDANFKELYEEFKLGDDSCKNCEYCDFYHICNYKNAPKKVDVKKEKKSIPQVSLTDAQKEAIYFTKGLCRINAGAGAGKTMVVAFRTALLRAMGAEPEEICLITFTDAGAKEMKERVALYLEDMSCDADDIKKMTITTFNSFGNNVIAKYYKRFGYTKAPEIIDEVKKKDIIANIINSYPVLDGLDYYNFETNMLLCKGALPVITRAIDVIKLYRLKNNKQGLEFLSNKMHEDRMFANFEPIYDFIYQMYEDFQRELKENNYIEYADQELLMLELTKYEPFYMEQFGFKHVIVDEFQDSSELQIDIVKLMVDTPSFESLMVVGDDSQSIYSFRDTTPDNIINFFDIMKERGKDIFLVENHRSTPEIIKLANDINDRNTIKVAKDLIATRKSGKQPYVQGFRKKEQEYEWISNEIKRKIDKGEKAENIAFIARTRHELLEFGDILTKKEIPWTLSVPEPMFENSKIQAAMELTKSFMQEEATQGLIIYLNALYQNQLLEKEVNEINTLKDAIKELIDENRDNVEYYFKMLEKLNYDDDEVYESFIEILKKEETLENIFKYIVSFEKYGEKMTVKRLNNYPGVVLTTAHSSKGLEFPIVYNSITKYYDKTARNYRQIEEARRLLFVSITRAKDELYVTGRFYVGGTKKERDWNFFLKEVYSSTGKYFPKDDSEIDDGIPKLKN